MFDVGWSELMVIGGVALLVIKPQDIPSVVRTVSGFVRKARMMASDFQQTLTEAADQADLRELRKQLTRDADDFKQTIASVDLVNQNSINDAGQQIGAAFDRAINHTQPPQLPIEPATTTQQIPQTTSQPALIVGATDGEKPKKPRKPRASKTAEPAEKTNI